MCSRSLSWFILLGLLIQTACIPSSTPTPTVTPITFTYWGSDMERTAIESMISRFETLNPDIDVLPIQIPYEEYLARVTAMIKEGNGPDVGYFSGLQAPLWAGEGKLLDLTDLVLKDPLLSNALPETRYFYGKGKIAALNTAVETALLFYNKDVFDRAGLPYPPADPDQAWTWAQFVDTAKKLTLDASGKHPGQAGFNPSAVTAYGAAFDKTYEGWTFYPFIFSNGGEVVNEDGTRLLLDSPEAIEAMQAMGDMMWVDRVSPTPADDANLPGYVTMLQTGSLAMHISGQWTLLDYASVQGLQFGVGVLPRFKTATTVVLGSPTVIFAGTRHRDAAIRFYKFHNNPQAVDLFARGLWMPLQKEYYTEPDKMKLWLDNPAHPVEAHPAFTDYVVNHSRQLPSYFVRNYAQVLDKAIRPAIQRIWNNEATAAEALRQAVIDGEPLLQGRWDR